MVGMREQLQPPYVRPVAEAVAQETIVVKRSEFIAVARRADSEDAARDVVAWARRQWPDARHHCSAFIIHQDDAQPIERSNDDGEPAGTAGMPMLEVLKGHEVRLAEGPAELRDIVVVVIRYFGGTLLGTGGLVRAYHDATQAALSRLPLCQRRQTRRYLLHLPHATAGKIEGQLRVVGADVIDVQYGADVELRVAWPGDDENFRAEFARLTGGEAGRISAEGFAWHDQPLASSGEGE